MMLVEETTVPQTALPVAQFKDHLRLGSGFSDDGYQDEMLESYLRAAMAAIEARTGKILIERQFSWTLNGWRDHRRQPLPVAPISAVSSVTLVALGGEETLSDSDTWYLEQDAQRPSLNAVTSCLPLVPANGTVRVALLAGFGPEFKDLPGDLAQAVLMLAAHFYEYRHDVSKGRAAIPFGVSSLIERYRTVRVFVGGAS